MSNSPGLHSSTTLTLQLETLPKGRHGALKSKITEFIQHDDKGHSTLKPNAALKRLAMPGILKAALGEQLR